VLHPKGALTSVWCGMARAYAGELARFCGELEDQTHDVATVQEIIPARVFQSLTPSSRDAVSILSLADIPLDRAETETLFTRSLGFNSRSFARMMRELRMANVIEVFGGDRLNARCNTGSRATISRHSGARRYTHWPLGTRRRVSTAGSVEFTP
jgi:hypothetical protein